MGRRSNGEGSITKRKDGRWSVAYTVGGKRGYAYGKTRKEGVQKLREALADSDGAYYRTVPTTPNTEIGEYLGRWLNDSVKESVRVGTYERYESVCRVHIIPHIGKKKLTGLAEMDVQSLYRERLDAGCNARTVQYLHVTLHKALKQAVRWRRLVSRNVAEAAVPPRCRRKK